MPKESFNTLFDNKYKNTTDKMQPNIPKQVPMLPGHIFTDPYKENYHKKHQFDLVNGVPTNKTVNLKEE